MAQIVDGIRSVLSHPTVYSLFQNLMGAKSGWQNFISNFVKPFPGMVILDIGCGPCDILDYLENVDYFGFDISAHYISRAKEKYGDRGTFTAKLLTPEDLGDLPKFDVVICSGVLHHLDDAIAIDIIRMAFSALKPGGRFLSIDPVFESGQNPIARYLISKDRGQNVRTRAEYGVLARSVFPEIEVTVRHKAWIPYTHCFMVCTKSIDD